MNRIMNSTIKFIAICGFLLAAHIVCTAQIPPLWTAGGNSAGSESAGQASHVATDASGNVTVVSGPGFFGRLVVTSYTSAGVLRWQRSVAPLSGTMGADWVAVAPNGDVVALGATSDSHGRPYAITLVRYTSDGTLLWRVDPPNLILQFAVGRLLVDAAGSVYVTFNNEVDKYSASGAFLWAQTIPATFANSMALGPDGSDVVVTGNFLAGSVWVTASFDATTGASRWSVTAPEGIAARDVVVDSTRAYVTGEGYTGAGTPQLAYFLTVVAYDRTTGARLWRKDKKPVDGSQAAGLWMAMAPDGSLVVTGQGSRGFLDWYTVAFETTGAVRWEAVRDGGLNTDEIPAAVLVLADGTTVVTGKGGPNLPGGYVPGITAGYSSAGTLLWEAFSPQATVWAASLSNSDVCATGGYDAFVACFRVTSAVAPPPEPTNLTAVGRTGSSIGLNWINGSTAQTEVRIERCQGIRCANFTQIAVVAGTASSFTDTGLPANTTYLYRARAFNGSTYSQYSNATAGKTLRLWFVGSEIERPGN